MELTVRRSRRARRIRLIAEPGGGIEVVVPVGATRADIERALDDLDDWIERQERRAASRRARRLGYHHPGFAFVDGVALVIVDRPGVRATAALAPGSIVVSAPDAPSATAAIERLYRRLARRRIEAVVTSEAARLGVTPGRISIRDPRRRYGSCNARGDLSFTWRLILAPPAVLRYVVVHELCHIGAMHHGPAYWARVEAAFPTYREQVAWLHDHGWELRAHVPRVAWSDELFQDELA